MPESKTLPWHLYIIRTNQGQLYTGITQDVTRRFMEHQAGGKKAAKYLRGKGPLKLEFQQKVGSKSSALKIEFAIKKLPKQEKEKLTKIVDGMSLAELGFPSKSQKGS